MCLFSQSFDDYWSKEEVQRGLKQGTLIEDMKSDVYIAGTLVRNRALNADVVAVEILPREEWRVSVAGIIPFCDTGDIERVLEVIGPLQKSCPL
ncbi:hypothetical protein NP493_4429g00000 [Ridgeia piscesae]|uniref:Uncharacterized protein n=1 Tax=Ridgeia piscesae TaxID=27915 RepID=A0AAD9J154_RIDPI|nr:hypothetical protein NP493_4429g00000 [Ridgeia piscesae]